MKPTALVFGCTGQDGSYLCKSLIEKGFKVIGTSRKRNPNVKRLRALQIERNLKVLRCDLQDCEQIKQIIQTFAPEEIYNLSAQSSVGISFKEPAETHKSIVNSTINILETCREIDFKGNIFFAGSSEIFGSTSRPADLKSNIDLRSPYATAKYQSFLTTKMYREIYKLNCVTGILFNHESPLRDETFVIKKIINTSIKIKNGNKEKLILGNINIKRDWGNAQEYVEAIQLITRSELNKDYIVCTGESNSLQIIVERVFQLLGLNWMDHVQISKNLFRSNEIENSCGNPDELYTDLGWKAKMKINELIKTLINYEIRSNKLNID